MMKKTLFLLLVAFSFVYIGDAQECMDCHVSDMPIPSPVYPAINASFFGSHININTADAGLSSSDCTGCHYNVNTSSIPHGPVSTYTCEDCHQQGSALRVNNHLKNANISVNVQCYDCHSKTSSLFKYSASASAAHYGMNAGFGISPGEGYCAYCHQNSSTVYKDVMQNPNNILVGNHTSDITSIYPLHPAGSPNCTNCHGQDKLHGTNITRPLADSGFCNNCHLNDRIQKNKHAGKVECIRCHSEVPSDVHSIKYILPNGSYQGINATKCGSCHVSNFSFRLPFSAANCTSCHQGSGLIKFAQAPIIPTPVNHSTNPYSGALWNGSQPAYWSNASQQSSCDYCHGNTLHDPEALGKVENIRSGNMPNQGITSTSYWCANCHYSNGASGNYFYNAFSFYPVPPEIQNKTGITPAAANDGTSFFNHSLGEWSDKTCLQCHGNSSQLTTALFVHNVAAGGGGADCASCHDIKATGGPLDKRIDIAAFNNSVHYRLNRGGNSACWACHGNGAEPDGHPPEYKSPRKCSNDECHSLNQKYRAPMVYSHFKNASLNDNPGNAVNLNVTTGSICEECHANSVKTQGKNMRSTASHYALRELPDSINCIYCHLNKENSEKWGNATLIYKNRTSLVELDRERNKFSVKAGDFIDLGFRFRLKLLEISVVRGNAIIEILKDNVPVDRSLINIGNYTYEEYFTIDNSSVKLPAIVLNVTEIFKSENTSFIQFEGFRLKRVHAENNTISCYLCHVYARPEIRLRVIERVDRDKDDIFYTRELANFTNKKEYNETTALLILANITENDMYINIESGKRKAIFEGERWNISENFSLLLKAVNTESDEAFLQLQAGNLSYEDFVGRGEVFEYTPGINYTGYQSKNITIFSAKVSEIIQTKPKNMVVLEEVVALSPDIKKIMENETIEGYNAGWLWENSTLVAGRIPQNFHSPQIFGGRDGGGDCLSCHGTEGFVEKRIDSLGRHKTLNGGGNNACRACHGGEEGTKTHPVGYKTPRDCRSCHAATRDNYNAVYIGDEEHKNEKCEACHVPRSHDIIGFNMLPAVKDISLLKQGNRTIVKALAVAGYKMKIRGARYYIDTPEEKILMSPVDGIFDSQTEEVFAEIEISNMSPGKHVIYIESMERNDKWGIPASLAFTREGAVLRVENDKKLSYGTFPLLGILAAFLLRRLVQKK
ncbi:hypothetical protein ANME2D_02213 [Candidatus Methanoperedens nitroreducens]|uniref:S-layer family duplication domain-containing protein n=1 Tax=Candidatus Methanoperedens nitratireducens TaxID=1392998 RepID=A0A062V4G8_9EURY|nr:S-layer protein domain-containing protein [Candidatus Methanoperedens nitroreducens]KCZ71483.1 hypothetical protein ANME2D_02213 [Candidatus Methanoperedens nitroreducens]MDJ1421112.1 S-layer protein domain-containing protein [Candidatus Methanoperedens sp.]